MNTRYRDVEGGGGELARSPLVESPFLLEAAQALAQVGSWVADLQRSEVAWSSECYRICGLPPGSVVRGETFFEQVHPDDRERVRTAVTRALSASEPRYDLEYRVVRPDGETRWILARAEVTYDEQRTPLRIVGIMQDITVRKSALEALHASEQRYRRIAAIVEWSNDAIASTDLDGTVVSWNRSSTQLYGYTEEEMLGRSILTVVPEALHHETYSLIARARRGEPVERHATLGKRKDGTHVEVALTLSPIRDAAGAIVGYAGISRDLSDQRRAETALLRAEQQLREAQKMEAVGLLAGGVAHDFNNLLSVIVGYTELVLESLPQEDPLRSDLLEVRKAGASAVSLTRQLLAFSRRQMLQPRVINLNQIVTALERMLERLVGAQVTLRFALNPDLGRVSADPGQIEQVILNLALNARDAMASGGRLTIATANIELESAHAEALNVPTGRYVMLAVSDTGAGIDPMTRARIFEPFFTTKEKGKGTGLGLSTALGIVQQSKGAIEVDSTVGVGTTFRVYLPRTDRPAQSAYSVPPARVGVQSWETVLLVEDDDQVRALARTTLRRHGYQVLEAENGEQALRVCRQHDGDIHLLLTDVVMPRMGGRELAARIAALRPGTKVLFMSGYASDALSQESRVIEGVGLLHKPITPNILARKVREALDTP